MADPGTGEFRAADRTSQGGALSNMMNAAGALMSVVLIGGLGVWGYQLAVRDVSGVPVVLALEGPMRVQPEDPGGQLASHQGLAVNGVQAVGKAAPTADRLVLAPEPVGLIEADQPGASPRPRLAPRAASPTDEAVLNVTSAPLADQVAPVGSVVPPVPLSAIPAPSEAPAESDAPTEAKPLDVAALAEQLAIGAAIQSAVAAVNAPAVADPAHQTAESITEGIAPNVPGVTRSPRPLARPKKGPVVQAEVVASQSSDSSDGIIDVDVTTLPLGTNLVQLGAFDSAEVARKEWLRLAGRLGDYLDDKKRVIQKAKSGGKTFYRLRALGFEDINDARRFCSALMAENAACIPVVLR